MESAADQALRVRRSTGHNGDMVERSTRRSLRPITCASRRSARTVWTRHADGFGQWRSTTTFTSRFYQAQLVAQAPRTRRGDHCRGRPQVTRAGEQPDQRLSMRPRRNTMAAIQLNDQRPRPVRDGRDRPRRAMPDHDCRREIQMAYSVLVMMPIRQAPLTRH
jgi:hypothetical protein